MQLLACHLNNLDITITSGVLDLARNGIPLRCIPKAKSALKPDLGPIEIEVRDYIETSGRVPAKEVAEWIEREVYEPALHRLLEVGIIVRVVRGRHQIYRVARLHIAPA